MYIRPMRQGNGTPVLCADVPWHNVLLVARVADVRFPSPPECTGCTLLLIHCSFRIIPSKLLCGLKSKDHKKGNLRKKLVLGCE